MSKKPQYDPEEIRFPDQKIETSYPVSYTHLPTCP